MNQLSSTEGTAENYILYILRLKFGFINWWFKECNFRLYLQWKIIDSLHNLFSPFFLVEWTNYLSLKVQHQNTIFIILKMRGLRDTDGIHISKKIEFRQKTSLQYKWGFSQTQTVFKFQIIEYKQNLIYMINEGFDGHRWYSKFKEHWIQTKISLLHKWGF